MRGPYSRRRVIALGGLFAIVVLTDACIRRYTTVAVPVARTVAASDDDPFRVATPLKIHLLDGSTVVFRTGAWVGRTRVTGSGRAYALMADSSASQPRDGVPMDSIVGMETFEAKMLQAQSAVLSLAATAVGAVGFAGLMVAIFGSCPTVYADSAGAPVLQAEGFSYAIAPLLEHRDLDPLRVRPSTDGILRLELRNEALETHFLNHVELLAVHAGAGATVVPDQSGRPVAVSALRSLSAATDRAGRDLRETLARRDGALFATAPATLQAATASDLDDWLELEADGLPPGDSVAVVLRVRNSLLNTVLLYDGMLGGRDAPQWMAEGLQHISTALDLSRWYVRTMGMHVTVTGGARDAAGLAREAARLGDVGPIAFRDVAIVVPRPVRDAPKVRVRLRFVADDWRIDDVMMGGIVARPQASTIRLSRVVVPSPARGGPPTSDTAALGALSEADGRYLETRPGQRMTLEFDDPTPVGAGPATYLIAWQGWYREWIRASWMAYPVRTTPFVPGDSAVAIAIARWRVRRDSLERQFYSSRIPVR